MQPFDSKPTRKRPLTLPLDHLANGVPTIVLVGPDVALRKVLFKRLVGQHDRHAKTQVTAHSVSGSFLLRDSRVELISLRGPNPVIDAPAGLDCHFALCVSPGMAADDPALNAYFSAMRALTVPVAVALVTEDGHTPSRVEGPWRVRLRTELLADAAVFRVDCGDQMSPELFARLLIAPASDQGRAASGIEVDD